MTLGLPDRGLVVTQDRWPHGRRARYCAGCRCDDCRRANREYEQSRVRARIGGDWNGLRPADAARAHLLKLRRQGVGLRIVEDASGVARSILLAIVQRKRRQVRARTERKILGVTSAARGDATLISARDTWQRIGWLLEEGFTKRQLSKLIGQGGRALQLGRERITVRNAAKVERLWRRYAS